MPCVFYGAEYLTSFMAWQKNNVGSRPDIMERKVKNRSFFNPYKKENVNKYMLI